MPDPTVQAKVHLNQGATLLDVEDGGQIAVAAGGQISYAAAKAQTKSSSFTAAEADVGQVTSIDTDGVVITLPATVVGMVFEFVNAGADGAVGFSVSPSALDKIMGCGLTSADNKDLINTKATAKKGDRVVLVADGVNGWYLLEMIGTWAREA